MSRLSIGTDAKTVKGERIGYMTGVQYFAPSTLSGRNVCPFASPGCIATCLNTAGRGVFNSVQAARIARTKAFRTDQGAYMRDLAAEVGALVRKARRAGMTPLVRLNGTSDLPWENIALAAAPVDARVPVERWANLMTRFPAVQFYDYTKNPARMRAFLSGRMPRNYHLTFSRSECNDRDAAAILAAGGNVAVVFDTRKGATLPTTWNGYRVVDGDLSDVRPADPGAYNPANGAASLDHRGVVVGLRAKGKARRDTSGFVVKTGG